MDSKNKNRREFIMKRILITTIVFAGLSFAVLFSMSVPSYSGEPMTIDRGCMKKQNGQFRYEECYSDADCLPSEQCVLLGTALGCPSLIGGATGPDPITLTDPRHLVYFSGSKDNFGLVGPAQQSVERAGSFRNLDVRLTTPPGGAAFYVFVFEVNGGTTPISCKISGSNISCEDTKDDCVDVNPGDLISFGIDPNGGPAGTKFRHTIEFNGCVCCDGQPPYIHKDGTATCRAPQD
jgi:hypothetical protein